MIRRTPQPGDIGLTTVQGPVGALIRFGQELNGDGFATWEHAFIVLPGDRLIEAQPGGARIGMLSEYDGRHVMYLSPPGLVPDRRWAICDTAEQYVGVGYGWLDYMALAAHRFHLPAPGLRRYIASTRRMICSQLVDQAYRDAGVELFADGRWPGYVTPADLFNRLK
jgi:cell wall-associated NlpC family hydrolase